MNNNSLISSKASIGKDVKIGNFCIIEDDVVLNEGVIIEDYAMVKAGTVIGNNTKVGTYSKIGKDVVIGNNCSFTSYCEIRDFCMLGNNVSMGSRGTVSANTVIENDVIMKYSFVVTDTPDLMKNNEKNVGIIRAKARFGANVVIMPGIEIGENAEIGACSQVRKNVPANEIWFGIPAKFYRKV